MAIHRRWEIDVNDPFGYLFPLFAILSFVLLLLVRQKAGRGPLAAASFYLVMIAPVLGFASQAFYRYSFVAEHFQYLAGIGLLLLFVGGGYRLFEGTEGRKAVGMALTVPILLGCAVLTWQSSGLYEDSETLFTHNLKYNPDSWGVHTALGAFLLVEPGKSEKALEHLEAAVRLNPGEAQAYYNLGVAQANAGRFEEAIESYQKAIQLEPNFPPALNNLGIALEELGRYEEAIQQYERALELDPEFLEAGDNRVKARFRLKFKGNEK